MPLLLVRRQINKYGAPLCKLSRHIYEVLTLRALLRVLLLISLMLGSSLVTQTQKQYEDIIVTFISPDCSNKEDFGGSSISIDGNKVVSEKGAWALVNLTPGNHVVSGLREPNYPDAKLV